MKRRTLKVDDQLQNQNIGPKKKTERGFTIFESRSKKTRTNIYLGDPTQGKLFHFKLKF